MIKTVTVSQNRQIAIPADFDIKPGEKLILSFDTKTGEINLKKSVNAINELYGIAKDLKYSTKQFLQDRKQEDKKRNDKLQSI